MSRPLAASSMRPSLLRSSNSGFTPSAVPTVNQDWTFDLPGILSPGAFVRMTSQVAGWYLKAVMLDGKTIPAHLDTGAPLSSMKLHNADSDFGLKPDSPGMQKKDLPAGTVYFYQFKSLAVGGV